MIRRRFVALALCASCGVRTPAPIDVAELVRTRGAVEARRDLEIRLIADPRDVAARLALAALDEQQHRPADAIGHLEAVAALGGPLGTRWRDDDRARLARLLLARGRVRLDRGAPATSARRSPSRSSIARVRPRPWPIFATPTPRPGGAAGARSPR